MTVSPPPAAMLTYVTFQSKASTRPIEHSATWAELADQLTQHARRPGKDGPGWSPAIYKRDRRGALLTRANTAVAALTCAVADVDHIGRDDVVTLREHIRELGLAGVIYSTHSSTETEPRVRVVVPFAETVPAELWPRLWPTLAERIFLGLADRAASDAARLYYLPSAPTDALTIADRWEGAALDWQPLPLVEAQAAATPAATTGAGAIASVDPADMPILERLFSGRHADKRMKAFLGDYTGFDGDASRADQSIANGLLVYCRGDVARAERIMRAGPWRPKWDDRRGATTVLGYTIGKALAAYQAWASRPAAAAESVTDSGPEWLDEWPSDDAVSVTESPEQTIARLQRENAQVRATHAVQMAALRSERADRQGLGEILRGITAVLALPKEHASPAFKVLAIAGALEIHSRASRGISSLPAAALEERTGLSDNMVSALMRDWAAREDSPIKRRLTREWRKDEFGQDQPITVCETVPLHTTLAETLTAICAMGGPSSKEQQRREKDRERTAANQAWGRCSSHDNTVVAVKGYCPECGEMVGETLVRREDFDVLNPGIRDSGAQGHPQSVNVRTTGPGFRDSDPSPVSLFDYAASRRPDPPPARCPAPGCSAMQFRTLPDGSWRCLKSGHDPSVYRQLVPTIAGGSE